MIDLTGRHIFIVGGGRGIGAAAARMAAKAGASVTVNYIANVVTADKVVAACPPGKAWAVKADASVDGAIDDAVDRAVAHNGALNGMVISAGIFEPCKIEDMTVEFWERTMSINLRSTFLAVRAAARHLRSGGNGGSIVIYTSTAGQRGSSNYSAYATSKGAQILFMRSMALALAPQQIRVNCIAPSWTESDMTSKVMDAIGRDKILAGCPLGRIGVPNDVAGASIFLLSDMGSFITGTTVTVDGGIDLRG